MISRGALGLIGQIVGIINGGVSSIVKLIKNMANMGISTFLKFNESAMAFSRQAGLSAKQAIAYSEVLANRARTLGERYGIAAEEVTKLEQNLAKATGRVIMLSNAQADMQIAINRTIGEQTADEFSKTMVRTMGSSLTTAQGAMTKAYALAARRGLDAAGMSAKVAQNLGMVNRLNFRHGIDGLTRMVALSEKFGFNMSSIESVAESFYDIQDAIEKSAQLSMLGGPIGGLGGNPLDMAYEATMDPESLADRITKMVSGYAYFDPTEGVAKVFRGYGQETLRNLAKTLGVPLEELVSTAKKQAEYTYKNNLFGADINRLTHGNEDQREYILNKAQFRQDRNNGQGGLVMTDMSGKEQDIEYFTYGKGLEELKEMMKFSQMSDEEIVRKQAEAVISIKDQLTGYLTTLQGLFASEIQPYTAQIKKFIGDIYNIIKPHFRDIANNFKELLTTFFRKENLELVKNGITAGAKALLTIAKWVTSSWGVLLGALLVSPILAAIAGVINAIYMYRAANAAEATAMRGAGAAGTGGVIPAGRVAGPKGIGSRPAGWGVKQGYNVARRAGYNPLTAAQAASHRMSTGAKVGVGMGAGLIGMGIKGVGNSMYEEGTTGNNIMNGLGNVLTYGGLGFSIAGPYGALAGAIGGLAYSVYQAAEASEKLADAEAEREAAIRNGEARPAVEGNILPIDTTPHEEGVNAAVVSSNQGVNDELAKIAAGKGGDNLLVSAKPRELIVTEKQWNNLRDAFEQVKARPYDGNTYVYKDKGTEVSNNGDNRSRVDHVEVTITFKGSANFNLGNYNSDLDLAKRLANDVRFKDMIYTLVQEETSRRLTTREVRDTAVRVGENTSKSTIGNVRSEII